MVSEFTTWTDRIFWIFGVICMILLVGVTVAMLIFVFRYRRSRARTTRQIGGYLPLEIFWIVMPTVLVVVMFFYGYGGFKFIRGGAPPNSRLIKVIAQQWSWSFIYPEDLTSNKLVLPVGEPVQFEITSRDVVHGFYLPAFRVKEDAVPGRINHLWIQPFQIGKYHVFCSQFCGRGHSQMLTTLDVLSAEDYRQWVLQQLAERNKPVTPEAALNPQSEDIRRQDAPQLYQSYCASCHGEDGRGLLPGARNFTSLEGWKRGVKLTDIFVTISEGIEGTQMRPFTQVSPWQRFALAHHVAAFYKGFRPAPTQQDIQAFWQKYNLAKPYQPRHYRPLEEVIDYYLKEHETKANIQNQK